MNKKEVQQRIRNLYTGEAIPLEDFTWDNKTRTIQTTKNQYAFLFMCLSGITFITGGACTFNTGDGCTFDTSDNCTFNTGSRCTFDTSDNCTFNTVSDCTFNTGDNCTFNTGDGCTFDTSDNCTFNTGSRCTFDTSDNCTFNTVSDCTFNTGSRCTFDTVDYCTFNTGSRCTFDVWSSCTFKTVDYVINVQGSLQHILPSSEGGFIKHGGDFYNVKSGEEFFAFTDLGVLSRKSGESEPCITIDGERVPHVCIDGILAKTIKHRGNVYHAHVYNSVEEKYNEELCYIIEEDGIYAHGGTLEEARESLKYKISSRDTSAYDNFTLDTKLTLTEAIKMYRIITGACEAGTRYFCEQNPNLPEELTVKQVIKLTEGQYNHAALVDFFKEKK